SAPRGGAGLCRWCGSAPWARPATDGPQRRDRPLRGALVAGRCQMARVFLERADAPVTAAECVGALDRCGERLDRRQAGHGPGHGGRTDVVAVEAAAGAVRGVDDEVDLAVVDELDDGPLAVRAAALGLLAHHRGVDAVALEDLGGAGGGE